MLNNNIEAAKARIESEIKENGFDNNQIMVNFSDICTEEETVTAANEMGFEAEPTNSDGNWWIYRDPEEAKRLENFESKFGSVEYEGKKYIITEEAQAGYDSKYDEIVYNATAITGEKDEFGNYKAYEVIWKISDPDAEDEMDACDWSEPYEVEDNGMGFNVETGETF